MAGGKIIRGLFGKGMGALENLETDALTKQTSAKGALPKAFKINEDGDMDFTQSAPADSDQIKGFMSFVDMIHVPSGTRIPAETMIRGHEPDFELAPGIPKLDDPEIAQRLLMGEISVDEARKELMRKKLKGVE
jgi:hypothetical protein